ncbi:MarR family transcriptional regulator [Labrenzia sp. 011]|uniref:MarR family winged helix-turn-helix transcriptional regulator n=1 Tax=Labrenzia sp. 011 TaxID=2171494 RepID=UPI000D5116C9|nr:MarR family transcriptional regulator [Labrenzia sp. 011]PVB60987.1 MarR family transcriptional regulator [Labrenzia sp. 011]
MNQTTDQMSLLDAIGFSAPEETEKPKKDKPAKADPDGKKPRRKATAKGSAKAAAKQDRAPSPDFGPPQEPDPQSPTPEPSDAAHERLQLDRFLCFALYSANHAMNGVYKPLLREIGLTYPQYLAMTVLWETNNVPVGTITSKLQLDTNTLTPLLKRLETMELVTRTRNPKDERQVILKLTRKGRALQKKTERFSSCILSSTGLAFEEAMALQDRIMKLRDNLRKAETGS